ncbi:MAG: hypothetical protein PHF46_03330 [Candidatus Gracilibacteria bacterium]|nr:hypothetical protein [Candidatus Gracilibacteria bacterium]MDD3120412.1 hypothetical protein [Candidatus Gracilibacteria bacterium]MDD4530522.1 hypothetical protein [Candidatus Gracilibacteria bacterium]
MHPKTIEYMRTHKDMEKYDIYEDSEIFETSVVSIDFDKKVDINTFDLIKSIKESLENILYGMGIKKVFIKNAQKYSGNILIKGLVDGSLGSVVYFPSEEVMFFENPQKTYGKKESKRKNKYTQVA